MKYTYYVAILHDDNSIEYVTRIYNSTKTFYCEKGKPALKLTKTRADDLMFGMVANCCTAAVIKTPDFYELRNEEPQSKAGMKEYLVKVRYALSGLKVFRVRTDNIYRIVGKFYCTSLEKIDRIDYSVYTPEREKFWVSEGYEVKSYTEPILSED